MNQIDSLKVIDRAKSKSKLIKTMVFTVVSLVSRIRRDLGLITDNFESLFDVFIVSWIRVKCFDTKSSHMSYIYKGKFDAKDQLQTYKFGMGQVAFEHKRHRQGH